MSNELLLKQIEKMDKKTDEFAELYHAISEKYFDFDNPDEFQQAAAYLYQILNRAEEWKIEIMVKLFMELSHVARDGGCRSGTFGINVEAGPKEMFFKIYDEPEAIDRLQKQIHNMVVVEGRKQVVL